MVFVYLLALVPLSMVLGYWLHPRPIWVFVVAALAIVPLAEWIRRATEHLANRLGGAAGGLINVSFGNAAELILAIFVLRTGAAEVVKAQITGSIVANGLLGLGLAILVGSIGRDKQVFKRETAGRLSSLLILSVIALLLPALFDYTERGIFADPNAGSLDEKLSLAVAVVLIVVYAANLLYTFITHRDVFSSDEEDPPSSSEKEGWPLWKSLAVLVGATALTAVEAEMVSGALESTASSLGLSTFFLGITVLAVIGNAAEYLSAVYFARQNRMNLVMTITVGSSIQVALLLTPVLVIVSHFFGTPMNLVFANPLELIAIAGVAFAVNAIAQDGETTWFEGLLLVAVYVLLGFAFFFATPPGQ